jgi:3',5'-cyclic-AMP phosphodiesterase
LKIALITDLHVAINEKPYDVDTEFNFEHALSLIDPKVYNHLILAGDLCCKIGERETYDYIRSQLQDKGIPFSVIAGNHDCSKMIQLINPDDRGQDSEEYFYKKKIGGELFLFLDTNPGYMSENQFIWLENELNSTNNQRVFIIMHHPPIMADSLHMEPRYSFTQSDKFLHLLKNASSDIIDYYIFTGHYHIERFVKKENIHVFITPSCFVQIDPRSKEFKILSKRIAYRDISIYEHSMNTTVYYSET